MAGDWWKFHHILWKAIYDILLKCPIQMRDSKQLPSKILPKGEYADYDHGENLSQTNGEIAISILAMLVL